MNYVCLLKNNELCSLIHKMDDNFSLLSASSLLYFSSVHIVGSLTSKLPSIIHIYIYTRILYIGFVVYVNNIYVYNICIYIYM